MPWIDNENGERKYVLSIYSKEELPTWSEVYNEWYKKNQFFYDPNLEEHQTRDPYWKIPHLQYLQAVVCNQFNKMLFEDGYREGLLLDVNTLTRKCHKITDIRFALEQTSGDYIHRTRDVDIAYEDFNEHQAEMFKHLNMMDDSTPPPIYSIPMPKGTKNIFITNNHPRTDITSIPYTTCVMPVIKMDIDDTETVKGAFIWGSLDPRVFMKIDDQQSKTLYSFIIQFMLRPFSEYFEGGVGWKDDNGNLIDSPKHHMCEGVGVDPAL